jgi:branched-chain amino acid transport system ATP-binding protein
VELDEVLPNRAGAAASSGPGHLLEVEAATVRFGGNVALDAVSITAEPGVVTGLIGPNGAGKTTLFNVITGLLPPNQGKIRLAGKDVTRLSPTRRARRGLGRTFQRLELFSLLSVRENIRVAADVRKGWSHDKDNPAEVVEAIIERIGLTHVADARVDSLPTGQCRLVELGRCLATKPQVLLLDEPASGQDENETIEFARLLRSLAADGVAVVLVEHDVALVMDVCTTVHVLDFGQIIATGTPAEIQTDEAVLAAYLGSSS